MDTQDTQTQTSSKKLYWIIGLIIIVLIAGALGYKLMKPSPAANLNTSTANNYKNTSPTSAPPTAQPTVGSGLSNKTDSGNPQLQQDAQDIQGSMNKLQDDQTTSQQDTTTQAQDVPQQ